MPTSPPPSPLRFTRNRHLFNSCSGNQDVGNDNYSFLRRSSCIAKGRITTVINPAGVTIESYTYDSQGRPTKTIDALSQSTSVEHDSANRPITLTDRKGQQTRIGYTEEQYWVRSFNDTFGDAVHKKIVRNVRLAQLTSA